MVSENESVARRFFEELWNGGELGVADELIAAEHVHHVGGQVLSGPEGVEGAVTWLRTAFPDLRFEIDDLVSDGDRVALRWTASGTHLGPFDDLQPTGRNVEWKGADWLRLRGGQIIEVWAFADGGVLLDQLMADP
jgi:predicted ester cyclase